MAAQDAQIPDEKLPAGYGLTSARVVRGPAYPVAKGGAFMTIRLQYNGSGNKTRIADLPKLEYPKAPDGVFPYHLDDDTSGLSRQTREKLDRVMSFPNGGVIYTGPTGGGKTTAIFECLKEKARTMPWRRQVWVEDPTELPALWAIQMFVPSASNEAENGSVYSERGRTALRMAPKTIFYGELRGPSVAMSFFRACQTGHDGWSTIHSNDPFQAVERIEFLDPVNLDRRKFCDPDTVRAFIGVRLVPRLCDKCCVPLSSATERVKARILRDLETWGSLDKIALKGPGCPACSHTGSQGRRLIMEIVLNDDELAQDFIEKGVAIARRNYRRRRADACPSLLESAINLVLSGIADPNVIEDKVAPMRPKESAESPRHRTKKKERRPLNVSIRPFNVGQRPALRAVGETVNAA